MQDIDMIYRVCYAYMKNAHDAEDATQDAFVKLLTSSKVFESAEHEKAWLIRTAINVCKDKLKSAARKNESLSDYEALPSEPTRLDETLQAVLALPDKYKTVIYLYYYEGYSSVELAKILRRPQSTVRSYLSEARRLLKERLGENFEK